MSGKIEDYSSAEAARKKESRKKNMLPLQGFELTVFTSVIRVKNLFCPKKYDFHLEHLHNVSLI